jgi:hypothetical protein
VSCKTAVAPSFMQLAALRKITFAMKLTSIFVLGFTAFVSAGVAKRQSGPVDAGTDKDCSWYDQAYSSSDDCQHFEDYWGLSHEDFVAWVSLEIQ